MLRAILFAHRWLGVVVGLIMTVWCLSGFVMMYVDYPRLSPGEQLRGLTPLHLPPGAWTGGIALAPDTPLNSARVEMMAGRPVLRIVPGQPPSRPIAQMRATPAGFDLATGQPLADLPPIAVRRVGETFGRGTGIAGPVAAVTRIEVDQWTVQTFRRSRPLYRVDYADPAGTTAYVAGNSGEVVQRTTRAQRFWNWLGAVPHWLYPTILRQNGVLWDQVVVWTSLTGCFLTATGLWVGIARLRRRRDGRIGSPFAGIWWWHHIFGLCFGILTLTWVASGLFSMNPWGFLDSMAGFAERRQIAGPLRWGSLGAALGRVDALPAGTVRIDAAPLGGTVYLTATTAAGKVTRLDGHGRPAPLHEQELRRAIATHLPLAALTLMREEDAYYYAHKFPLKLPVWRAILADREETRLYVDPDSGTLIRAFDRNGRGFRWLQDGLHSLDLPVLRSRPLWDLVVLPLLAGVTLVCATGTWMGFGKVRRDLRRARRRLGKLLPGTGRSLPHDKPWPVPAARLEDHPGGAANTVPSNDRAGAPQGA